MINSNYHFGSKGEETLAKDTAQSRVLHWVKTRNLTIVIMALWVVFAILVPYYAHSLNSMTFMGFPLGYYMCVQGSLFVFVALILFQNWRQDSIDDEFGVGGGN